MVPVNALQIDEREAGKYSGTHTNAAGGDAIDLGDGLRQHAKSYLFFVKQEGVGNFL